MFEGNMVRLICGALAIVLLGLIVMRRRSRQDAE
jgi:MYXO-CTERM domain-containing protein